MVQKTSHKKVIVAQLVAAVQTIPGVSYVSGQGANNRFRVADWNLLPPQGFQFGDFRIETANSTIAIEVESGGGITNLAKYWPWLVEHGLDKRFVLIHIFRLTSTGDYVAHRLLWQYLVDRMRDDLSRHGINWGDHWEARLFDYQSHDSGGIGAAIEFIRGVCSS